jgi:hypothetical protein
MLSRSGKASTTSSATVTNQETPKTLQVKSVDKVSQRPAVSISKPISKSTLMGTLMSFDNDDEEDDDDVDADPQEMSTSVKTHSIALKLRKKEDTTGNAGVCDRLLAIADSLSSQDSISGTVAAKNLRLLHAVLSGQMSLLEYDEAIKANNNC